MTITYHICVCDVTLWAGSAEGGAWGYSGVALCPENLPKYCLTGEDLRVPDENELGDGSVVASWVPPGSWMVAQGFCLSWVKFFHVLGFTELLVPPATSS